ncbi:MAG: hypothetical protein FJ009_11220 [Chloroflexi bacterium]|nr:hypothetical protein [Chloroflexota bacterium]
MQKWEYLQVTTNEDDEGASHPRYVAGEELPEWQKISLSKYFDKLGEEGWELVSEFIRHYPRATYSYMVVNDDFKETKWNNKSYKGIEGYYNFFGELEKVGIHLFAINAYPINMGGRTQYLFSFKTDNEVFVRYFRFKRPKS